MQITYCPHFVCVSHSFQTLLDFCAKEFLWGILRFHFIIITFQRDCCFVGFYLPVKSLLQGFFGHSMHCYGTAFYKEDLEKFLCLFSLLFSTVMFREPVVLCDTLTASIFESGPIPTPRKSLDMTASKL